MEFFHTAVSEKAIDLVIATLRSARLSEGQRVREFEAALATSLGLSRPVGLNSGTSALHLALVIAGVGPSDEVILPAQTFVATGTVVLMQGATPVFADIDPHTGNVDPEAIRHAITPRTRAVIPVHWAGYPCDMDEISTVAEAHGVAVIEDAAHALGATYKGRPIGSISRFTALSFQAIKHLTTGDGGSLCCARESDEAEARRRRWFGIDRDRSAPSVLGERVYELTELGFKYHMNDVAAAIGLGNLQTFEGRLTHRRLLADRYRASLSGIGGIELLHKAPDRESACWVFTLMADRREDLIRKLAADHVPTSVVHRGIDRHPIFGGIRPSLRGQREFDSKQLALPLHEAMSASDVDRICALVRGGW